MLKQFLAKRKYGDAAHDLYVAAVNQAREPHFYRDLEVEDSLDGRFDLIIVHVFLVINRLKQLYGDNKEAEELSQVMFDIMFGDMDRSLREMGVGDLSVGKKVKAMAKAFFGRVEAYDRGLAEGGGALEQALLRNLYRGREPKPENLTAMADYMRRQYGHLQSIPGPDLFAGHLSFAELTG
jgi:cytochrome b pre-mRNA-processing protein 3